MNFNLLYRRLNTSNPSNDNEVPPNIPARELQGIKNFIDSLDPRDLPEGAWIQQMPDGDPILRGIYITQAAEGHFILVNEENKVLYNPLVKVDPRVVIDRLITGKPNYPGFKFSDNNDKKEAPGDDEPNTDFNSPKL
ncbi:hypothetical protein Lbir_1079 [Legionella birminghamensis]|uniref:Uncharacterized protein n=1 Tax=Legionella birminghamensis TaxID=28083 RepID=A0A378I7G5_9GAMM|nr:hypothetical protein [Legionella birminghamensis]KTC73817.1 hypothetical protein Lbir_1079 [Legionella birminghamensis]STX30685.1 Uncharacterised protein [Legionella birminghamensis]